MHGLHRGAPFLSTPLCLYHRVIQLKLLGISKISEGGKNGGFFCNIHKDSLIIHESKNSMIKNVESAQKC